MEDVQQGNKQSVSESEDSQSGELVLTREECIILNSLCTVKRSRRTVKYVLNVELNRIFSSRPNCRVGPNTFFPRQDKESAFLESPILGAAKHGAVAVLKHLLHHYGNVIDVNCTVTCSFTRSYRDGDFITEVLHKCAAMNAACLSDTVNMDVVKLLVAHGALVNVANCRRSTPLMGAAFSGRLDVVKYLVKHGANVDAANLMGNTPLCAAAMGGHHKIISFLLKKGADCNHATITGDTALHIAATEGHLKVVRELISHGTSSPPNPIPSAIVPPPVILAASEGSNEVVNELLRVPGCPPEVKSDALLLLGATIFEQRREHRISELDLLWGEALALRDKCSTLPNFLPPVESYGNRVEIQSLNDFRKLRQSSMSEVYYQCLIIRERIMGYGDLGLIRRLSQSVMELIILDNLSAAETLWIRLLEMMVSFVSTKPPEFIAHFFSHSFYSRWRDLLEGFLVIFERIIPADHPVHFRPLVDFAMKGLEFLDVPSLEPECVKPDCTPVLCSALEMFSRWLNQIHASSVENSDESMDDSDEKLDSECEKLGREFVSKYLCRSNKSTLLHMALDKTNFKAMNCPSLLITALIRWGAESVVNMPDGSGLRPLYLAAMNTTVAAVVCLLDSGAHIDAVNRDGNVARDVCHVGSDSVFDTIPLPLSCQACHSVVAGGLPYEKMDLPPHVKEFIKLHDKP